MPAGRWYRVSAAGKVLPIPTASWLKVLPHDRLKADRGALREPFGAVQIVALLFMLAGVVRATRG